MSASTRRPKGFRCAVCGERHEGLLTDVGAQLPDVVWQLDYLERYARCRHNADLCTLDGARYFIRGVLYVPLAYTEGRFGWGFWVEVGKRDHDAYVAAFHGGHARMKPFAGRLANDLRGFPSATGGLEAAVAPQEESRPLLMLSPRSRHRLAIEQRRGIDGARHHELAALYARN